MSFLKIGPILLILPVLNGCITSATVQKAKEEPSHHLTDKVYHIERAVISKDQQLEIYLEGCLTNSSQKSRFTLIVSLEQIQNANALTYQYGTNKDTYYYVTVPRTAILPDWMPQDGNLESVPIGLPIPTPFAGSGLDYLYYAFGEYAKLLPDSTKTLYPVVERRTINSKGWPAELEFMYIDASIKHKYTIIGIEQVTIAGKPNKGYYCLLPLTVPADIVTCPFQLIGLLFLWGANWGTP